MSQAIGLIELEVDGQQSVDWTAFGDDDTLDGLFARLVGQPPSNKRNRPRSQVQHSELLTANLDSLSDDLHSATREVLAEIFLAIGRR